MYFSRCLGARPIVIQRLSAHESTPFSALSGDRGARRLFDQLTEELVEVEMPDRAVLTDIDTAEALADFRAGRTT